MSAKSSKRPLRSLTAHEKLDAIRRVHDGESKASVARDIGVPESTLRGWCKNEDKISYLSRQSSPDTDESNDHKDKKAKVDENVQPFNLSLKCSGGGTYSPNSDNRYTIDYSAIKTDVNASKAPLDLNTKVDVTPKSNSHISERERNRAELARLSVELGLNRPEMFLSNINSTSNNLADLTANIGLLAQWNNLLLQQQTSQLQNKKVTSAPADTSCNLVSTSGGSLLTTVKPLPEKQSPLKLPKEKQSVEDSVWYWLKTQQAMLGLSPTQTTSANSNGVSTSSTSPITSMAQSMPPLNDVTPDQSSWFWKWYKQFTYGQQSQFGSSLPPTPDKPILYQQLTKDKDVTHNAENLTSTMLQTEEKILNKSTNKARAVLDNLLFNNNNNVAVNKRDVREDEDILSELEALDHGEKFLKWLEACSEPSVSAVQIMQFKSLLANIKTGADRKNGDLQNKTKVKRK